MSAPPPPAGSFSGSFTSPGRRCLAEITLTDANRRHAASAGLRPAELVKPPPPSCSTTSTYRCCPSTSTSRCPFATTVHIPTATIALVERMRARRSVAAEERRAAVAATDDMLGSLVSEIDTMMTVCANSIMTPMPTPALRETSIAPAGMVLERVDIPTANGDGAKWFFVPAGRYRNLQHLNKDGTFGSLASAVCARSGWPVVVKRQTIADIGNAETALREIACLSFLTLSAPHPHVVKLQDCWVHGGCVYLVEQRHDGTLRDALRRRALDAPRRLRVLAGMLSALAHLHACGILHRDLKPSNVVIDAAVAHPRIIDLGSGRRTGPDMSTGAHVTTYPYRAPEEVQCMRKYTAKVDVWSMGCIYNECITTRRLFNAAEPQLRGAQDAFEVAFRRAGGREHPEAVFTEARDAGASGLELELLAGMVDPNPASRHTAAQALEVLLPSVGGAAAFPTRRVGQYVAPEYDVHDLSAVQRVVGALCSSFARAVPSRDGIPFPEAP